MVIEIDGDVHGLPDQKIKDEIRRGDIEGLGYRVLRYTNDDVFNNLSGVLEDLLLHLKTSPSPPPS